MSVSVLIADFLYKESIAHLELLERDPPTYAVRCPVCRIPYRLNLVLYQSVKIDLVTKELTVKGTIICPTPYCGWAVRIERGVAVDVESPVNTNIGIKWGNCRNCGCRCVTNKRGLCGYCDSVVVDGNGFVGRSKQGNRGKALKPGSLRWAMKAKR